MSLNYSCFLIMQGRATVGRDISGMPGCAGASLCGALFLGMRAMGAI